MSTPMRRRRSPCCARTASGQKEAELATALMKSRRRIAFPEATDCADCRFITAGICDQRNGGPTVILRCREQIIKRRRLASSGANAVGLCDAAQRNRSLAVPQGRTPFERIALLLQGGGALGAYQAGAYEALAEADLHPDWVAGISIGAINSAIIAGNPPKRRVDALREFWHAVSASPVGIPYFRQIEFSDHQHQLLNQARAMDILLFGTPNFFVPRLPPSAIWPPGSPDKASYYDTTPLRATLERVVDFDRINSAEMRFSVGAVEVRSGNFTYFDNTTHEIAFEHIAASGSLPPGFPATKIGDEYFWDG